MHAKFVSSITFLHGALSIPLICLKGESFSSSYNFLQGPKAFPESLEQSLPLVCLYKPHVFETPVSKKKKKKGSRCLEAAAPCKKGIVSTSFSLGKPFPGNKPSQMSGL